jgi:short-subunit dehydrogenase
MIKYFISLLIASGDGRILQIGSTAAIFAVPFGSVYNASKAALHAYSNTLRVELAPFKCVVLKVFSNMYLRYYFIVHQRQSDHGAENSQNLHVLEY